MSADGTGVVSHVGTRLLADVAAAAGLPEAFDDAAGGRRRRRSAHAPGRVLTDLAVLLADGGETITDLAVLRRSARTVRSGRLDRDGVAGARLGRRRRVLGELKRARAVARERAWLLRAEAGRPVPTVRCGGVVVPGW